MDDTGFLFEEEIKANNSCCEQCDTNIDISLYNVCETQLHESLVMYNVFCFCYKTKNEYDTVYFPVDSEDIAYYMSFGHYDKCEIFSKTEFVNIELDLRKIISGEFEISEEIKY